MALLPTGSDKLLEIRTLDIDLVINRKKNTDFMKS